VPLNQAGLFSGEGGTGKSIIELMKDVAHVTAKDWFGSLPEFGPAFYVGAEDEADELHRRLAGIAAHYKVTFKELIDGGLHVLCKLGEDATLFASGGKSAGWKQQISTGNFMKLRATLSQKISALTRCPAPLQGMKLTACRSIPSPCTCRPWRWWLAVLSPC